MLQPFKDVMDTINKERYIAQIKDFKFKAQGALLEQQLNLMAKLATPVSSDGSGVQEPVTHYIRKSNIRVEYKKDELSTEEDVDDYVEALRKTFKEQIAQNRRSTLY